MFDYIFNIFYKNIQTPDKKRESVGQFAGIMGIIFNAFLCLVKIVTGIIASSVSIVADGVNNLSDALSSAITVVCFKLSGKPADEDHPYGHERIEYVVTLFLAFLIMFIGYELIKTSAGRIIHPQETKLTVATIVALVSAIVIKLFMSRMYRHYSRTINSSVLMATSKDSFNDALSTMGILASNILSLLLGISLDGYVGVAVSLFIILSAVSLIKDAIDPLLGKPPEKAFVNELGNTILDYDGIIGIHDLIVHSYGPNKAFASVHAEVDASGNILKSHDLIDNVEREVAAKFGIELVIHMDPIVTDDERLNANRVVVCNVVSGIDARLTIHDFRMVPGNTHTNLIFDVVLPFDFKEEPRQLLENIEKSVKSELGDEYFCVVNFDRNYI